MSPELQELRQKLGMKEGQLLRNSNGELGDLLEVDGDEVIIGILGRDQPVRVPIKNIINSPKNS